MFIHLDDLDDGQIVNADLCIVGSGPAGLVLASELIEQGIDVCVVESGDLTGDDASQSLAEGDIIGRPQQNLKTERDRQFGGSSNSWAGACAPISKIVFKRRPWLALEGWPYTFERLEPFYRRAQTVLEIGPFNYAADHWAYGGRRFLDFDPTILETRIWQYSPPTNFGRHYYERFAKSQRGSVLLQATATEILSHPDMSTINGIVVRSLQGKNATVQARYYVLACGGIDNARLLLCSQRHAAAGLGNAFDQVGRYFMQHPHVGAASIAFSGSKTWLKSYKDQCAGDVWIRARIGLSEQEQERLGVLTAVASVINRFVTDSLTHAQSVGYLATKRLALALTHGRVPAQLRSELRKIAQDMPGLIVGSWRHLRHQTGALYFMSEQIPNANSRVTLNDKRDAFDMPQARVDWRLLPIDKRTIRVTVATIATELERLGIAKVTPDDWLMADDVTWPGSLNGGYHHMGTTRMGTNPRTSVVDQDAKVHGIDNLYIAGSSIFPSGGCANPTLTLVATSLKLADHLSTHLTRSSTDGPWITDDVVKPPSPARSRQAALSNRLLLFGSQPPLADQQ